MKKIMKKKSIRIAIAAICILTVAIIAGFSVQSIQKQKKIDSHVVTARKYLSEMDYEQAIAAYTAALEIEPSNEAIRNALAEAYLEYAESYTVAEEYETAIAVLKESMVYVPDVRLESKIAEVEQIQKEKEEALAEQRRLEEEAKARVSVSVEEKICLDAIWAAIEERDLYQLSLIEQENMHLIETISERANAYNGVSLVDDKTYAGEEVLLIWDDSAVHKKVSGMLMWYLGNVTVTDQGKICANENGILSSVLKHKNSDVTTYSIENGLVNGKINGKCAIKNRRYNTKEESFVEEMYEGEFIENIAGGECNLNGKSEIDESGEIITYGVSFEVMDNQVVIDEKWENKDDLWGIEIYKSSKYGRMLRTSEGVEDVLGVFQNAEMIVCGGQQISLNAHVEVSEENATIHIMGEKVNGVWENLQAESVAEQLKIELNEAGIARYIAAREDYYGTYEILEDGTIGMHFTGGTIYNNAVAAFQEVEVDIAISATINSATGVMDCIILHSGYEYKIEGMERIG